jgi:hypothetical protein
MSSRRTFFRYADLLPAPKEEPFCEDPECLCRLFDLGAWGDLSADVEDPRFWSKEYSVPNAFRLLPLAAKRNVARGMLHYSWVVGLPLWDTSTHFNMMGVFALAEVAILAGDRATLESFISTCDDEATNHCGEFYMALARGELPDTPFGRLNAVMCAEIHRAARHGFGARLSNVLTVCLNMNVIPLISFI